MKKTLMSLAALALFGQAHAQSSVSLFGIVDATFSGGRGSVANWKGLRSGGNATSQIGFRGVEDLGGGLKAGFWLEAEIAADAGAGVTSNTNNQVSGQPAAPGLVGGQGLTFNRRSIVSLGGNWGQVFLGRDYNPGFWNNAAFDPFGVNGVGTSQAFLSRFAGAGPLNPATGPYMNAGSALYVRSSNSIAYAYGFAPNGQTIWGTGGLYAHVMYYMGENASNAANKDDGTGFGVRVGYIDGPLNVAASYLSTEFATTNLASVPPPAPTTVALGDVKTTSLAASYDFKVVKPRAMIVRDEFGARSGRGYLVGVTAPVGVGEIRLAYSTYKTSLNAESSKTAIGYVHNLSKRTAVYTTYARVRNSGGAAQAVNSSVTGANRSSSGYDIGIRHFF